MNRKSEDYLREWFRDGPLPDEPESLHDFLATVPIEHPRKARGGWAGLPIWPQRALAGLAAAVVVALVGGAIVLGLTNRSNSPIPGGTPSPTATASGSSPAPSRSVQPTATASNSNPASSPSTEPTPGTSGLASLPTLTLPASAIKTANGVSLPAQDAVASQVWGSRYYLADWTAFGTGFSTATAILRYGDASTGAVGSVPLPLTQAELAGLRNGLVGGGFSVTADGTDVSVVVWYRLSSGQLSIPCPSNSGSRIQWRILVASIDPSTGAPGTFSALASGQGKDAFRPTGGEGCDTVSAPLVALSGGLIAYNIESPTTGHRLSSTIVLQPLAGGAPARQIPTQAMPIGLKLAGTNVAWLEADGTAALPLRVSTAGHPAPVDVDIMVTPGNTGGTWDIPKFSLDGFQITWDRFGTGQVLEEVIGGASAASATPISPNGSFCFLGGSDAGQVLLLCGGAFANSPGGLAIWSQASGSQLVQGYAAGSNGFSWLSNGWVATESSVDTALYFFRVSDLEK